MNFVLLILCAVAVLPCATAAYMAVHLSNDPILDWVPRIALVCVGIACVLILFGLFAYAVRLLERIL